MKASYQNPQTNGDEVEVELIITTADDVVVGQFIKNFNPTAYSDTEYLQDVADKECANLKLGNIESVEAAPYEHPITEKLDADLIKTNKTEKQENPNG
jgi:hypothetical protein